MKFNIFLNSMEKDLKTDDYEDYLRDLEYGDYLIYRENKKRLEKENFLKRQENEMKKGA